MGGKKMINLPKAGDYWARPDKKENGEFQPHAIYRAVGEALTAWELVELRLAILFAFFVESRSPAAVRAYGSIISANGRREALESAAQMFFHLKGDESGAYLSDFNALIDHAAKAGVMRNEIAHGVVTHYLDDDEPPRGTFLVPSDYSSNKTSFYGYKIWSTLGFDVKYRYTSVDISAYTNKLRALENEITQFFGRLAAKYPFEGAL